MIGLAGCPCKISDEDYQKLQDLRKEERTLSDQISKLNSEKSGLGKELSARKSEVDKCKEDMDFVKKKLSEWPNVWPDWTPPQSDAE
jgi:predicted CopG family antitoxin